ncbi:MAG: response regulator [Deltaproteobacteria bacterium]|nr:response regulator [Deltaproteobacteria bacterium]
MLVVDDNEDVAVMLGDAIDMIGYRSYVALDATSALQLAESFAPDVALLDLGLPDLDGCELGRRLQARHGKQLFLVAVTAWSDAAHRRAAHAAGFHAYLVKPVKIADVQAVVRALLASARVPERDAAPAVASSL